MGIVEKAAQDAEYIFKGSQYKWVRCGVPSYYDIRDQIYALLGQVMSHKETISSSTGRLRVQRNVDETGEETFGIYFCLGTIGEDY